MGGPVQQFADDLDDLVARWMNKPEDDKLTGAEAVGTLQFKAFLIMQQLQEEYEREQDE